MHPQSERELQVTFPDDWGAFQHPRWRRQRQVTVSGGDSALHKIRGKWSAAMH